VRWYLTGASKPLQGFRVNSKQRRSLLIIEQWFEV
jgi:hypothetical protein